jgi:hypothetical protein
MTNSTDWSKTMTPDALWRRYAAIWSLGTGERDPELAACLAEDASYCDPNGLVEGRGALSAYMEGFQHSLPGGGFHIRAVHHHHGRTLAHWTLQGPDGKGLQDGTSFGLLSEDGRLQTITGFFPIQS